MPDESPTQPSRPHVNVGATGRRSMAMPLAVLSAGASISAPFLYYPGFGPPPAKAERENPKRVKTPEDLARIEAARAKQARKAAKRAAGK